MTVVDQTWAVEVEHRVKGSPEKVFTYFTDPEKYTRWKGTEAELDPRPGGAYRITMAPGVQILGEYVVVDPPRRLMLTWGWDSALELPTGLRVVPPGSSTVEFTFEPDGDGTIIRVRHLGMPTERAHWAHELGWNSYLPRLASVMLGEDPGDDPSPIIAEAYLAADRSVQSRD